jgi:hypothetical protein
MADLYAAALSDDRHLASTRDVTVACCRVGGCFLSLERASTALVTQHVTRLLWHRLGHAVTVTDPLTHGPVPTSPCCTAIKSRPSARFEAHCEGSQTGHRRRTTPQLESVKRIQHDGGRPDRASCKLVILLAPEWAGRDTSHATKTWVRCY